MKSESEGKKKNGGSRSVCGREQGLFVPLFPVWFSWSTYRSTSMPLTKIPLYFRVLYRPSKTLRVDIMTRRHKFLLLNKQNKIVYICSS